MSEKPESQTPKGQFLVYQTDDGQLKVDVRLEGETAWLTQAHMAELFQTTVPNVSMHLRNVFAEGELQAAATVKEFLIVRHEGERRVSRAVEHEYRIFVDALNEQLECAGCATSVFTWRQKPPPDAWP